MQSNSFMYTDESTCSWNKGLHGVLARGFNDYACLIGPHVFWHYPPHTILDAGKLICWHKVTEGFYRSVSCPCFSRTVLQRSESSGRRSSIFIRHWSARIIWPVSCWGILISFCKYFVNPWLEGSGVGETAGTLYTVTCCGLNVINYECSK